MINDIVAKKKATMILFGTGKFRKMIWSKGIEAVYGYKRK
jgi:hypothetical protein